jgi:hypothetical protein
MELLDRIIADIKLYAGKAYDAFLAIESAPVRLLVIAVLVVIAVMLIWQTLPLIIALIFVGILALVVKAVIQAIDDEEDARKP